MQSLWRPLAAASAAWALHRPRARCELPPNPVWPSGVSEASIDRYVEITLADAKKNLPGVPDVIESMLYKSTCRITLNAVYCFVGSLHGTEVLQHQVALRRVLETKGVVRTSSHDSGIIGDKALERVADELLQSKNVNQLLIPDFIERRVYAHCLKLVFRLLDRIVDTMAVRFCGHELSLSFEPLDEEEALAVVKRGMVVSAVDEQVLDSLVAEAMAENEDWANSWWAKVPMCHAFVKQLHKTMFCLVIGVLEDMTHNAELTVLGDRLSFQLVPMVGAAKVAAAAKTPAQAQSELTVLRSELAAARFRERLSWAGLLAAVAVIVAQRSG